MLPSSPSALFPQAAFPCPWHVELHQARVHQANHAMAGDVLYWGQFHEAAVSVLRSIATEPLHPGFSSESWLLWLFWSCSVSSAVTGHYKWGWKGEMTPQKTRHWTRRKRTSAKECRHMPKIRRHTSELCTKRVRKETALVTPWSQHS